MLSVDNIKVPQKERNYLTAVEVNQLVDKIDHSLVRLVSWFLFRTGLRISECLNLTINDVDFAKRQITIIAGKGNKDRIIPMSASVWERLYVYLQSERPSSASTLFFITKRSGKLTRTTVNNKLKYAAQNLGWTQPVTAHVLRHSFSFNLIKNKVSIVEVQKLLGHTSLAVTSVYAHTDLDELTKAVNTLL
nr:tyrosine-type recombinase/integrase [Sulfoacidibacillus ferrooxidans]